MHKNYKNKGFFQGKQKSKQNYNKYMFKFNSKWNMEIKNNNTKNAKQKCKHNFIFIGYETMNMK